MSQASIIEIRAADWIAERDRYTHSDGHWPTLRQEALDAWLSESTAHRVAYLRLENAWRRGDRLRALSGPQHPAADASHTHTRAAAPRSKWWGQPRVQRAVARVGLVALALVLAGDPLLKPATQRYESALGQREAVALADGSHLTLNTATRLHASVNATERRVWLDDGEAFFDIAHDAAHPFVIFAGNHRVTVLGTKFSLYREGDQLRVAVLEGRVKVDTDDGHATVLTRDDAAVAEAHNVLVTRRTPQELDASLSWMHGKLVFDQATLGDAARQFNRYNRRQLLISDAAAAQIGIGGVFDADNVDAFARLLHVGFGLAVETQGDEIRVSMPAS